MAIAPVQLPPTCLSVVDARGVQLALPERERCELIPDLEPVPAEFAVVLLWSEDRRFEQHAGFEFRALVRASLAGGRGGSSITMQLARAAGLVGRERTISRKVAELWMALRLERTLTKRAILKEYVNRVAWGRGVVGVRAASRLYFGKEPSNLSLGQVALLVSLLPAPSVLDPRFNLSGACARRDALLSRLANSGARFAAAATAARSSPCELSPSLAPAFEVPHLAGRLPRDAGAVVTTSIRSDLQSSSAAVLSASEGWLASHGLSQAAVVVLDTRSSEVLALLGSLDFGRQPDGQIDGTRIARQTGSALKPFVYVEAFTHGYSLDTLIDDTPATFTERGRSFSPRNGDGVFLGRVPLRTALAWSRNIPAVRLAQAIRPARVIEVLEHFGLPPLPRPAEFYGLGIALGTVEASLLDLTGAYATLARGGLRLPVTVTEQRAQPQQVAVKEHCDAVLSVLADEALRADAFGAAGTFGFRERVAVKTGTSTRGRDVWLFAMTEHFVVGIWAGNFDGRPGATSALAMEVLGPTARELLRELGVR
jgi:penicillin-binding protein 1C